MSKNDFNATINLPKTDFPMRAGLAKREPEMLQHWYDMDLYHEMLKKNDGKPRFSLHDGPPFSNGDIHMGHALNKALKDFIIRSYAMRGYYTPYIPGWDNHGMPIESAIIKEQKLNHKAMSIADFRSACHDYAQKYIDRQMAGFKRMGVMGDWEHPYKTMNKGFESDEVRVFGKMYQNGHIYKGLKPVYWCAHDETALAEAEIEYQDDPCTTVFVKFPMHDDLGKLPNVDHSKLFFVIWTTTIWTLPGNLAIALNPRELYNLVQAPNGEVYIMADALTEKVMHIGGFDSYEVLEQHPGDFFENMLADHPFLPKTSRLVLADYVTMDSGTGCVHTAPGFGADDYLTCKRYGMDMVVPVDDQGRHTDYAGKYAGMTTEESNPVILADMKEAGSLFASEDIVHSYPHCWRCKQPIIFRATPQWFCSVDSFKEEAVAACENVRWLPAWGKERMAAMIRERADWCISRQRRWGLPILVSTTATSPCAMKRASTPWPSSLKRKGQQRLVRPPGGPTSLPEGFTCPHCGGSTSRGRPTRSTAGSTPALPTLPPCSATRASGRRICISRALDQYLAAGSSRASLTSVGALGQGARLLRECLTHGWTVDGEGKAMHWSLATASTRLDLIRDFGAESVLRPPLRTIAADVRCSKEIFKQLTQNYLRSSATPPATASATSTGLTPSISSRRRICFRLDRWAITKLNDLIRRVAKAYDNYEFHVVSHAINDFCVVELSSFYLDIIKDRLYCEERNGLKRRSAQTALFLILDNMARMFAPILAVHLRRDLAGHAAPCGRDDVRNVVLNEMVQPYEASTPSMRRDHGPLGYAHRPAQRRQRRAGAGPRGTRQSARRSEAPCCLCARATRRLPRPRDREGDMDLTVPCSPFRRHPDGRRPRRRQ